MRKSNVKAISERFYNMYSQQIVDDTPDADIAPLFEFYNDEYGKNAKQGLPAYNDWLYRVRSTNKRYYAVNGSQVVGHQGSIGCNLQIAGQPVNSAWAIDLRVRPEWKMKGLGVALITALQKHFDFLLALGVSDEAYKTYLRLGWHDMGYVHFYIRPVKLAGFGLNLKLTRRLFFCAALLYFNFSDWVTRLRPKDVTFAPITRFGEAHDVFLSGLDNQPKIGVLKNTDYLNWRYFDFPGPNPYQVVSCEAENACQGILITKEAIWHDRKALVISEIISSDSMQDVLISQAVSMAKQRAQDLVLFEGINETLEIKLKQHVFRKRPYGSRMLYYTEAPENSVVLQQKNNWQVSGADSDLDFCFY